MIKLPRTMTHVARVVAAPSVLVLLGVGLAAAGQAVSTRALPAAFGWLAPFGDNLRGTYGEEAAPSVAASMVLLASGAVLFVLGARRSTARDDRVMTPVSSLLRLRSPLDYAAVASFLLGAALFLLASFRLWKSEYDHRWSILLVVAIALMAAAFARGDLQRKVNFLPRPSRWTVLEAGFVLAVVGAFIAANSYDLTSWRYTAWGDEYSGYQTAKSLTRSASFNPFLQGVDGLIPFVNAASQALVMKALGVDRFAWLFHDVLVAALALVCFYLLARELFSVRVAVFATALLASSHYLFAYVRRPINIDAILPEVAALWLLAVGLRRNSALALFASGGVAALGFYTYFTGRIIVVVLAAYVLTFGRKAFHPGTVVPLAMGALALLVPLFAVNGYDVIDATLGQSVVTHPEGVVGNRVSRFGDNVVRSLMGFNYNPGGFHYVFGSLLDPLTAVLYVLGIGVVLLRVREPAYRLVAVWWGVGLAAAGFTNPYDFVPMSRLHFVLPAAVLLAAVGLDQLLRSLGGRRVGNALALGAFALLLVPIVYLNAHRFWYEAPREYGSPANAVAVRAVLKDACRDRPFGTTLVSTHPGPLFAHIFDSYALGDRNLILLRYSDAFLVLRAHDEAGGVPLPPPEAQEPIALVPYDEVLPGMVLRSVAYDYLSEGCIVVVPDDEQFHEFVRLVRARYPNKHEETVTDLSGQFGLVSLFY